jgi:hypothetical protein
VSWDDDPYDDDDLPADEGVPATVPCPSCGADVYEDSEQCPVCGDYIVHSASMWDGKPLWWVVLGVLGIAATIAVLTAF